MRTFRINKTQNITKAMRELKLALGLSLLDHWEWNLDHTETHYIINIISGLPLYLPEEELFIWKMSYQ